MSHHEGLPSDRKIEYPYMPDEGSIEYVDEDDFIMEVAKEYAQRYSLDKVMPNSSLIIRDGAIIGIGANGSNYHETNECERIKR